MHARITPITVGLVMAFVSASCGMGEPAATDLPWSTPTSVPMATATPQSTARSEPVVVPTGTPLPLAPPGASVTPAATLVPVITPEISFVAVLELRMVVAAVPAGAPAYDRDDWQHWTDVDGDCQNTRAEVLIAESKGAVAFEGCRVVSGSWNGLFTGSTAIVDAGSLDVDHMVPLANAHRSGGWAWDAQRRQAYANDLGDPNHLIAVTASANRSKGARGPEDWRPSDTGYWCEYAMNWVRIKSTWDLFATAAEHAALGEMLGSCPNRVVLVAQDGTGSRAKIPQTATPVTGGTLPYDPLGPDRNCGDFPTGRGAQTFYESAGGPQGDSHRLDSDGDGIVCESLPGAP